MLMSVASIAPAYAADDTDNVSAAEVENALADVSPHLLEEAASASATADAAAVVVTGETAASVPRDPADGVDLNFDGSSLSIGLPALDGTATAVTLDSGAITYPSRNGVANTVVPLSDGVQMLTTVASPDASTSFSYPIEMPIGGSIALAADGSAIVTDAAGDPLVTTGAPWAVDARGVAVPTHYEVAGTTLIQVVDHDAGEFSYPIVADPKFTYWWGGKEWWPASRVNVSLIATAVAGYLGMPGAALIVGSAIALCNQAGRGIWVYWTWAGQVWCTGP
ncbi:hypothetical protein [Microbacterium sp. SSM24]|uniref:hypothetical protein n=1 Tax=Microbacterium sp. SSM24 TaxID=2991714 RepID=UPI00222744B3|nr:hypothetical protein [Microbacterium sp. SSM24]MCW3492916.1 hypothetical protein [Microbacterium sp. SSM24]